MIPKNRIRYYRKLAGESRVSLAKQMNVTPAAVGHWETGLRAPRDETKIKIAHHFGVPVENIFFVEDSAKSGEKGR